MSKKAVVLLSGGIDSATVLAIAQNQGYECGALSFDYGQRHAIELKAARAVARQFGIQDHRTAKVDLRMFGGSALTDAIEVPKHRNVEDIPAEIPVTYVPARNIIFLSYGTAMAEVTGSEAVFIGVNALDYSGYPDCRPSFIEAYQKMIAAGTQTGVAGNPIRIQTPLIDCTKAEIIHQGSALGVDYSVTLSCYDPTAGGLSCGTCDSCLLRKKGFYEAQIPDPTRYAE